MHANIVCPECGHSWQPAAKETACPQCHANLAVEWNVTADAEPPARPPEAISEGEPPFVIPVEDDEDDDPRYRRAIYYEPRGWVVLSVTIALVGLSAGIDTWHASLEIDKGRALLDMLDGRNALDRYQQAQQLANYLAIVELILLVATTSAAFSWLYLSYANLHMLRIAGPENTPTWSLWRWLVPPGAFVLTPRGLQELWRASNLKTPIDSDAWKKAPGYWLIWLWWAFFLLRHVRVNINIVPFPVNDPTLLKLLLGAAWITTAACFCSVAAAALFCVIALRLEHRQWRRFERVQ
jgi:hypothetical protein